MGLQPVPDPPLTDGVVVLRGWRESDVPQLMRACRDPEIPRWTAVPDPYTEEMAWDWVRGVWRGNVPPGDWYSFAVVPAENPAELHGSMGLMRIERGTGEIGYWSSPWVRGRGITTRAVQILARFGLETVGLQRVELLIAADNAASLRVAEKAGFTREGTLRNYRENKGIWRDHVVYSALPGEIQAR